VLPTGLGVEVFGGFITVVGGIQLAGLINIRTVERSNLIDNRTLA
jgi:hypothetical protein